MSLGPREFHAEAGWSFVIGAVWVALLEIAYMMVLFYKSIIFVRAGIGC